MIYLDYASTTPVDDEVAQAYTQAQKQFFANPDSLHSEGVKAAKLIADAKKQMASLLNIKPTELYITSGATEANNLSLFGVARAYQSRGNHIITTNIEHASVDQTLKQLQKEGFEITFIPVNAEGIVEIDAVLAAITEQTILISIMQINNEIGSIQPIAEIAKAIKATYPQIIIHSDMAQSIGKVVCDLQNIDLATFSGHKFFAPKTIGLLYKKENITLQPLFYGGQQEYGLRPGTMNAPLIAATAKAMRLAFERLHNQGLQADISKKRNLIIKTLCQYEEVKITLAHDDLTKLTPYIIHFQITNSKVQIETYLNAFSADSIYLSTRSTCHSKSLHDANPVLQAIGCTAEQSRRGLRISISHLTTLTEINDFAEKFATIIATLKL